MLFRKKKKPLKFSDLTEEEQLEVMRAMMKSWDSRRGMKRSDARIVGNAVMADTIRRIQERRKADNIPNKSSQCD